jgi:hypothetical protein
VLSVMGELRFKILDQRHNQKVGALSNNNFDFVVIYVCVENFNLLLLVQ